MTNLDDVVVVEVVSLPHPLLDDGLVNVVVHEVDESALQIEG